MLLSQHISSGNRNKLDQIFDTLDDMWAAVSIEDPFVLEVMTITAFALRGRMEIDGSKDDLEIQIEVLRAGICLEFALGDRPEILRLMLVGALTTRYESSQDLRDLEEAEKLLNECSSESPRPAHEPYRQEITGVRVSDFLIRIFTCQKEFLDFFENGDFRARKD